MTDPIKPQTISYEPIITDKALLQKPAFAGARMWRALFTSPDLGDNYKTSDGRHTFKSVLANIAQVALRILLAPTFGSALLVVGTPLMAFSILWNAANVRRITTEPPKHIRDLNTAIEQRAELIRQLREELTTALEGNDQPNRGPRNDYKVIELSPMPEPLVPPEIKSPRVSPPTEALNTSSSEELKSQAELDLPIFTCWDDDDDAEEEEEEDDSPTITEIEPTTIPAQVEEEEDLTSQFSSSHDDSISVIQLPSTTQEARAQFAAHREVVTQAPAGEVDEYDSDTSEFRPTWEESDSDSDEQSEEATVVKKTADDLVADFVSTINQDALPSKLCKAFNKKIDRFKHAAGSFKRTWAQRKELKGELKELRAELRAAKKAGHQTEDIQADINAIKEEIQRLKQG